MTDARYYILRIKDTMPTGIVLFGPFVRKDEAADYGATAERRLWNDNPNWQVVLLDNTFGLPLIKPSYTLNVEPGAYRRAGGDAE